MLVPVNVCDSAHTHKGFFFQPIHSLALIEVMCADGNVGREARVLLCLDMMVARDVSKPVRASSNPGVCAGVQI